MVEVGAAVAPLVLLGVLMIAIAPNSCPEVHRVLLATFKSCVLRLLTSLNEMMVCNFSSQSTRLDNRRK